MVMQIQHRRGTSAEHAVFTGAEGEITVNIDNDSLVVHDGATPGGHETAKLVDLASKADQASLDTTDATLTSAVSGLNAADAALTTSIGLKADQTALDAVDSSLNALSTTLSDADAALAASLALTALEAAANKSAIDALALIPHVDLTDYEALKDITIEGLGALDTELAVVQNAVASQTPNSTQLLSADLDLGGYAPLSHPFPDETDTTNLINCASGFSTHDLGAIA